MKRDNFELREYAFFFVSIPYFFTFDLFHLFLPFNKFRSKVVLLKKSKSKVSDFKCDGI